MEQSNNTQIAYFEGKELHISDYDEDIHQGQIYCVKGCQMIAHQGTINQHHFQHKPDAVCNLLKNNKWHENWKAQFKCVEQTFENHRTDVLLNENAILEIQNSPITSDEILDRNYCYLRNRKVPIWLINCTNHRVKDLDKKDILIEGIGRNILHSMQFVCQKMQMPIYCDMGNDLIIKIVIQSRLAEPEIYRSVKVIKKYDNSAFVECMNNFNKPIQNCSQCEIQTCTNQTICKECDSINNGELLMCQCKEFLTISSNYDYCSICYHMQRFEQQKNWSHINVVRQQGAGTGKTYKMVEEVLLKLDVYEHIVFIVKTNGTKSVIAEKIQECYRDLKLKGWYCGEMDDVKQWIYKNTLQIQIKKRNKITSIIIATIDSLFCTIATFHQLSLKKQQYQGVDFEHVAENISKVTQFKSALFYKKQTLKHKEFDTIILLDEAQDLKPIYCEGLFNYLRKNHLDFIIVGDILQTIYIDTFQSTKSAMFRNDELLRQYYNTEMDVPDNICRRFKSTQITQFVNNFINFDHHSTINENGQKLCKSIVETDLQESHNDVYRFLHLNLYFEEEQDDDEEDENNQFMRESNDKIIMSIFESQYEQGFVNPHDYHIITPSLKNAQYLDHLCNKVNDFWLNKKNSEDDPVWCHLHKSEDGQPIDLTISVKQTRISSIHASKGEGRPVTIVLGLDENTLKYHNTLPNDLKYESLLHVAVTRSKNKLFVGHQQLTGDVYERLKKCEEKGLIREWPEDENDRIKNPDNYWQFAQQNDRFVSYILNVQDSDNEAQQLFEEFSDILQSLNFEPILPTIAKQQIMENITDMIDNYEFQGQDMNMEDYMIRHYLFQHHIKEKMCTTQVNGRYTLLPSFYYQGGIFSKNNIREESPIPYYELMQLKGKATADHNSSNKCTSAQCDCKIKALSVNPKNKAIQYISDSIKLIFEQMQGIKISLNGYRVLQCPIQKIIATFFIYQHKWIISPLQLYELILTLQSGNFMEMCNSGCNCQKIFKTQPNNNKSEFFKQIYNTDIFNQLLPIIKNYSFKQNQKQNPSICSWFSNAKIFLKQRIDMYDEKNGVILYTIQKLTDQNFVETMLQGLLCGFQQKTTNTKIIIVSSNEHKKNAKNYVSSFNITKEQKIQVKKPLQSLYLLSLFKQFKEQFRNILFIIDKDISTKNANKDFREMFSAVKASIRRQTKKGITVKQLIANQQSQIECMNEVFDGMYLE